MTTGKGVRRLGLDSLLGVMALGRSFTLSATQVPHLQNTRIELISRSAVFKLLCSRVEQSLRAEHVPVGGACSEGSPQGQLPFALLLFPCILQTESFSK